MGDIIRLAIQKKGRLNEDSLRLIKECGIRVTQGAALRAPSSNFDLELLFLRDDDIPGYVADGVADLGIVGENEYAEKAQPVEVLQQLGFSKCRLCLAVPKEVEYNGVKDLDGKEVATSYPRILGDYLTQKGVKAKIHEISGSVEIAPSIGLAHAIFDIVSTGSTLIQNGLKEVEEVFRSQAILIANPNLSEAKRTVVEDLLFRIQSVLKARAVKYIALNVPNASLDLVMNILPGVKSPTIMPLSLEGWSSIHTVVEEDRFWEVVDQLKAAGAEGILVLPIEKIIS